MQLTGNLLIAGDSFCADIFGWPNQLAKKLSCPFNPYNPGAKQNRAMIIGKPGASWWRIRYEYIDRVSQNLDFVNNIECVVWIHPYSSRIFSTDTKIAGLTPLAEKATEGLEQQQQAVWSYYKHIHETEFHQWAQRQWWNELNTWLANCPKILHLFVTDYDYNDSGSLTGNKVATPLLKIQELQYRNPNINGQQNDWALGMKNHLTAANNTILADQLYEILCGTRQDFDITKFEKYNA